MVKKNIKKTKSYLKKPFALAITICVIANFGFGNIVFAKKIELNEKEVERIKTGLDIMKALAAFTLSENKLKTILNTTISIGEVSTDITYGLLALSALNEMDLVDLVTSQKYKTEATSYFNNILNERLSLINYYSGISYDIPRVLSGAIKGSLAALTLNTFSITNKVIEIFIAFENIRTIKLYDGLWYYFDLRRSNEPHEIAWEEAKIVMGWAAISNPFRFREQQRKEELNNLKFQFSTLWDKWGVHTTSKGIKEEIKEQTKTELRNSLIFAIKKYELIEKEPEPSFLERAGLSLSNFLASVAGRLTSFISSFVPGMREEEIKETDTLEDPETQETELVLKELQEMLDNAYEKIDALSQEKSELTGDKENLEKEIEELKTIIAKLLEEIEKLEADVEESKTEEATEKEQEEITQEDEEQKDTGQEEIEQVLCQKITGVYPTRNKVIINEIAWMGTINSASDEWIELKNISQSEVDLDNWQLLDKDQKIKIIFNNRYSIQPNGFFLLERTDDNSVPGISADLIYTGALTNTNEALYLFDDNCQLQDEALANPNWPTGDNSSKRTMERKHNLEWQTSSNIGGTPRQENSSGYYVYYGGGGGGDTSVPPPTPPSPTLPPPEILITEIQIISASSTDDDFIELYNPTSTNADISGFQLKKKSSTGNEYSVILFPAGTIISPQGYFLWMNSGFASSSGILTDVTTTQTLSKNNSLALLDKDKNIVDAVAWGSSTNPFVETLSFPQNPDKNQSLGRKWSTSTGTYIDTDNNYNDFQIQEPTPKAKNKTQKELENQPPVAYFTYSPQNPIVDDEILFDAASSTDPDGSVSAFIWDFGDNTSTTTNQATTTHIFSSSSDFIIGLQVIDNKDATSSLSTTTIKITEILTPEEIPSLSVVINEIAWMGAGTSSSLRVDEWIELYNTTSTDIDLNKWTLSWSHGTNTRSIIFSTSTAATTTISGNGFYLIERTNDDTVSDISADWFGPFISYGLNNNGEKLELRNAKGDLVDVVDCSSGWFAGTTTPAYISMERINANASGTDPTNWASNNLITRKGLNAEGNKINGTPKSENSVSKSKTKISESNPLPFNEFDELTLTYLGSPYIVDMILHIPEEKILNIEPEVILKFVPRNLIHVEGVLKAVGKEEKEIVFTSTNEENWTGIIFESDGIKNQSVSQLEFVKIEKVKRCLNVNCTLTIVIGVYETLISFKNSVLENSGDAAIGILLGNSSSTINNVSFSGFKTALSIEGGAPEIKKSSFSENNYGIYITKGATPKIEENIFQNNIKPIYFSGAYPFFRENSAENNDYNGVLVGFGNLATSTWQADLPYIIETNTGVGEGTTLTIKPGTIIKLKEGGISFYGRLIAQGNSIQPIIFTSLRDDEYGGDTNNDDSVTQPAPGNWSRIYFTTSSDSILDHVIIRYGGNKSLDWWKRTGAIALGEGVEISLKNSLVEKNIYAVSFLKSTNCDTIGETIEKFEADNTVFQENDKLTYPVCP